MADSISLIKKQTVAFFYPFMGSDCSTVNTKYKLDKLKISVEQYTVSMTEIMIYWETP